MAENGAPSAGRQVRALVITLLALVAGLAIVVFLAQRGNPPAPQPGENGNGVGANGANGNAVAANNGDDQPGDGIPAVEPPNREECLRLLELRNRGLALLENGKWSEADAVFSELAQRLPNEPLAVRNLGIARLMQVKEPAPSSNKSELASTAERTIDQLRKLEPNAPTTYRLAAGLAKVQGESDLENAERYKADEIRDLERAADLDPNDAATWLAIFHAARFATDPAVNAKGLPAFKRAFQADPQNSYLALELAIAEAEAKDPAFPQTFAALRELLQPAMPTIVGVDPAVINAGLDKVQAAITAGQLDKVWGLMLGPANVARPEEWIQSDLRRVSDVHPLRHIVLDFQSGICPSSELIRAADVAPDPPIEVAFQPFDASAVPAQMDAPTVINLADFDLDRQSDLVTLSDAGITVVGRKSPTDAWTTLAHAPLDEPMAGLLVGDLDRDAKAFTPGGTFVLTDAAADPDTRVAQHEADIDLVVFGPAGARLLRNVLDADGTTRRLVAVEQPADFNALRDVLAGVLVDLDADGDLDLVFSTAEGLSLWSNRGDMTFYNVTDRSALPPADVRPTSLVAVDWDRDLDLDIVAVGPDGPIGYLENLRHGATRWRPFEGTLAELAGAARLAVLDADANRSWDLASVGGDGVKLATTVMAQPGLVEPLATRQLSPSPASNLLVWDFDNDSFLDLLAWGDDGLIILRANPQGGYQPFDLGIDDLPARINWVDAADLDADGDLDLAIATPDGIVLLENQGGNQNHWIDLRVRGEEDDQRKTGRVNHLGLGALLEVRAGPIYRPFVVDRQVTHIGLGKLDKVDAIRVIWTNGVPQVVVAPKAGQEIVEIHEFKGSCPYVYTWNGHEFEFLTDACWAAPLGLQLAEGVYAQPRAWEYLKIPGERMVPRDGRYVIQMTEELWEATYFDQVELIAIDHPDDVRIYTNEKVGPPDLAQFKVHTVRSPRLPVAARDMHGRDVLSNVSAADGQFFKGFDHKHLQGLTEEHLLELDLGPLPGAHQITLFLTGWMRPTDTSLNVAISQNPHLAAPSPPALWVGDGAGGWRLARPFMGFPGGKTKTIAVDLSGLFTADDNRLRIVTNQEFFWDAAFFTVDEEPAELKLTHLPPVAANLHYRGFSALRPTGGYGPDTFEYNHVSTAPKWPPMRGLFTRYGDVTELLTTEDDLLAVVGAGDEITIEFDLPADDPPAGWKRDFLLHNFGWDKDADLNTIYGQAVEPLPFGAMSGYPYRADESFPDTPRHRRYLRQYQTRQQNFQEFWGRMRAAE